MNPTAATAIHLMTEAQAAAEMDRLLDTQPDETEFLPLLHWEQEHRRTIDQLQAHIAHLQRLAQDAPPPQQLQPEPEETPVSDPNQERVKEALAELIDVTAKANFAHDRATFKTLQTRAGNVRFKIRDKCRKYGIPEPELPAPPVNPFITAPEPPAQEMHQVVAEPALPDPARGILTTAHQRQVQEENEERQGTIQQLLDVMEPGLESPALEKAGPGPYVPPTTASLLAAMDHRSPCAEDCIHPDHHHQAEVQRSAYPLQVTPEDMAALDAAMDREVPTAAEQAQSRAERIRRELTALLADIDELDDPQALRHAIDAIHTRLQFAYALLDEAAMEEAG